MERKCYNCVNWEGLPGDDEGRCNHFKINTFHGGTCPACFTKDMSIEEYMEQQMLAEEMRKKVLSKSGPAAPEPERKVVAKPRVRIQRKHVTKAVPMFVPYNPNRPVLKPFGHQIEAFEKFKDKDVIALFFEMGCGKSFTTLYIAQHKFLQGKIKGLLVIAPNDVHKQWYDDIVYGVDVNHDGTLWQEMSVDFEAQCVGGRGGQDALYEFDKPDTFKFVSVNVDTFSTPHKWEQIANWANSGPYMIAIDEATVIKNRDSQRSKRLLYEFNDVVYKGKTVLKSVKKCPVRAVLTGTPVTNGPIDLWSIMEFAQPNFFGRSYYSFKSYYSMQCKLTAVLSDEAIKNLSSKQLNATVELNQKLWKGIKDCDSYEEAYVLFGCDKDTYLTIKHQDHFSGAYKHMEELKAILEPVAVFKKLTDCVDMPSVDYITRHVQMSPEQKTAYKEMKKNLLVKYAGHTATAKNKLVVSLRLQQISSGFIMGKKDITEDMFIGIEDPDAFDIAPDEVVWLGDTNPKLEALMRDVAESDKPLLILTRYSAEAAKIFDMCTAAGYKTGLFTGWKVVGGVDEFKEGNLDILVANSNKIARGFNLQNAHTTLFYSNTFSMEVRQQAEFRTFRMGQKHPCLYIDYVAADVDEMINSALKMKKGLLDYIRGDEEGTFMSELLGD